jgi:hypothetical protein
MVSILALSSSLKTLHISSEFEPLCAPLPITNYTHLRSYRVAKHFGLLSDRVSGIWCITRAELDLVPGECLLYHHSGVTKKRKEDLTKEELNRTFNGLSLWGFKGDEQYE